MVILEFFGMPGSGKSTVSHLLAERLRGNGYTVIEPSWLIDNKKSKVKRLCKKMLLAIIYELCNPFVIK